MDDLDILKKHWNENQKFPKVSKDELRGMIHKKSSSIVMWIFVISILEFIILNLVGHIIPSDKGQTSNIPILEAFIEKFDYFSMFTSLVFMVLFYNNYRKIRVYSSAKDLMKQIIKTKKTVNYYIYINLALIVISVCFIVFSFYQAEPSLHSDKSASLFILICAMFLITMIFLAAVWGFYKLIYGLLLSKLTNNLKELEKITQDTE